MANYAIKSLPEPTPDLLEAATGPITPFEVLYQAPPPEIGTDLKDIECWERQERFLWAYAHCGTVLHAARAVAIHPQTPERWEREDRYGFRERFRRSHQYLCAGAENDVARILRERPHQHDILRIARLNRLDPEHWRRSDPPPPPSAESQAMAGMVQQIFARLLELGAQTQQPAIEGLARALPPAESGQASVGPDRVQE